MVIIETSVFTRQVQKLLDDEAYRKLQIALAERPDVGTVMVGSGGLRKVRWAAQGRGKRGGVRVIYYWAVEQDRLLMLLMYLKSERDDLTREQLKILRMIVEEEYR
ncbi:MAG: type II toxin-antitoxin system RelE/ParE family toxin [Chloroflexota bacterium]